jgi:hypothetical protein
MEQLEPAASVAPQALAPVVSAKSLRLLPVMLATMLFNAALPVFESVAASAAEVVPVTVLGKESDAVSEATGALPAPMEIELLDTAVNPLTVADSV